MNLPVLSRRQALAGGAALTLGACTAHPALAPAPAGDAAALLDAVAWQLLDAGPESATSLGIDTGVHAALRSRLGNRSAKGVARLAAVLRDALRTIARIDTAALDPATQTSVAVVKSAFATALDGFALPYGDVAVGGWRNTPYVVIQNVGAYLDTPRFLDGDHPVRNAADAEAYLARLAQFPAQLDGELGRLRAAGRIGAIAPSFLLDKAIRQMDLALADARAGGGGLVSSLTNRTGGMAGDWEARAHARMSTCLSRAHATAAARAGVPESTALPPGASTV